MKDNHAVGKTPRASATSQSLAPAGVCSGLILVAIGSVLHIFGRRWARYWLRVLYDYPNGTRNDEIKKKVLRFFEPLMLHPARCVVLVSAAGFLLLVISLWTWWRRQEE